jgi:DNA-directed RNA polymerase specialized sigma24 family protein
MYSVARDILGEPADAEDVVFEIFLALLEKRAFLPRCPGVGYLLTAARHQALRRRLYAWERARVAMDPQVLVLAEQAMYQRHGPAVAVPR